LEIINFLPVVILWALRDVRKKIRRKMTAVFIFLLYVRDAALYASETPCRNVTLHIGLKLVCLTWRKVTEQVFCYLKKDLTISWSSFGILRRVANVFSAVSE
jgi:hypothetical protein